MSTTCAHGITVSHLAVECKECGERWTAPDPTMDAFLRGIQHAEKVERDQDYATQASDLSQMLRESERDVERLRERTKEIQQAESQRNAELESKVARYENAYRHAKEQWAEGVDADWSPVGEGKFWAYTSTNTRDLLMAAAFDVRTAQARAAELESRIEMLAQKAEGWEALGAERYLVVSEIRALAKGPMEVADVRDALRKWEGFDESVSLAENVREIGRRLSASERALRDIAGLRQSMIAARGIARAALATSPSDIAAQPQEEGPG